ADLGWVAHAAFNARGYSCLGFVLNRDHPADAEPVFKHSEFGRPKCFLERHRNLSAISKRFEDTLSFFFVRNDNWKRETFEARLAFASAVRGHQGCFADAKTGMHHFVFHSRLRHARFGGVLETAEHLHLRANSAAVEFQRLFASTVEKQIWLHQHIRISHTRSLRFVWSNVNVPLLIPLLKQQDL